MGVATSTVVDTTPTCWYYERGACKNGQNCLFKHEGQIPQDKDPKALVQPTKKQRTDREFKEDTMWLSVKIAMSSVTSFGNEDPGKMRLKLAKYAKDSIKDL